jgi:hypothetical protein
LPCARRCSNSRAIFQKSFDDWVNVVYHCVRKEPSTDTTPTHIRDPHRDPQAPPFFDNPAMCRWLAASARHVDSLCMQFEGAWRRQAIFRPLSAAGSAARACNIIQSGRRWLVAAAQLGLSLTRTRTQATGPGFLLFRQYLHGSRREDSWVPADMCGCGSVSERHPCSAPGRHMPGAVNTDEKVNGRRRWWMQADPSLRGSCKFFRVRSSSGQSTWFRTRRQEVQLFPDAPVSGPVSSADRASDF